MKQEIIDRFKVSKRRAGDPKLRIEMGFNNEITPLTQCSPAEQHRRIQMRQFLVYIRFIVNSKEVSRTKSAPLEENFTHIFGEIFQLKLSAWPLKMNLQIWQSSAHGDKLIHEIDFAVPGTSATRNTTSPTSIEFQVSTFENTNEQRQFTVGFKNIVIFC